jgi:transcriptional regulator with XRE-family HTH domain
LARPRLRVETSIVRHIERLYDQRFGNTRVNRRDWGLTGGRLPYLGAGVQIFFAFLQRAIAVTIFLLARRQNHVTPSERISGLIRAKNLKPSHVAAKAGIQPSSLTRYDAGDGIRIGTTNLAKLAAALDVSTDYLVGAKPELDALPFERVAAREALRVFQELVTVRPGQERRLRALLELPVAPRTVDAWKKFYDLLEAYLHSDTPANGVDRRRRSRVISTHRFGRAP